MVNLVVLDGVAVHEPVAGDLRVIRADNVSVDHRHGEAAGRGGRVGGRDGQGGRTGDLCMG